METNKINAECPVCDREFKISEIEGHVDKCLFLNAENKDSNKLLKRNCDGKEQAFSGISPKRIKVLSDIEARSSMSQAIDVSCNICFSQFKQSM